MQSKIWNKVQYGIRIKKGIPAMVNKRNSRTGIYSETLQSVVTGCDSIVTLVLTVNAAHSIIIIMILATIIVFLFFIFSSCMLFWIVSI